MDIIYRPVKTKLGDVSKTKRMEKRFAYDAKSMTTLPNAFNPDTTVLDKAENISSRSPELLPMNQYDHIGASLFVAGLLVIYALVLLLFMFSLVRKSRADLEVVDYLEDFKARRRASHKRRVRLQKDGQSSDHATPGLSSVEVAHNFPVNINQEAFSKVNEDFLKKPYSNKSAYDHHVRSPRRMVSFYPGLLRNDVYDRSSLDVIIIWRRALGRFMTRPPIIVHRQLLGTMLSYYNTVWGVFCEFWFARHRYKSCALVIWVRSRRCGCLVTWLCYHLITKPGNKTATRSWPDPYYTMPLRHPIIIIVCTILRIFNDLHDCIHDWWSHLLSGIFLSDLFKHQQ